MSINTASILQRNFINTSLKTLKLKQAISVAENSSLSEAISIMAEKNIGCLLVMSENQTTAKQSLAGVITERDILKKQLVLDSSEARQPVSVFMSKPAQVLSSNASIARAIHLMSVGGFRHIPILTSTPSQPLIFSSTDMLNYIYEKLTSKIENEENLFFDKNSVDLFFASTLNILSPGESINVTAQTKVEEVVKLMCQHQQGACFIVNSDKRVEGIFTERDFLKKIASKGSVNLKNSLQDFMTKSPQTLQAHATVSYTFNLMVNKGFRHMPIVSHDEKAVGMISVKHFID